MLKKSFFGLSVPRFYYESLGSSVPQPIDIPSSKTVTLYIKETFSKEYSGGIQTGDKLKTGQRIYLSDGSSIYAVSSITGVVQSIQSITSNHGSSYTAISIRASDQEEIDHSFKEMFNTPTLETMAAFLEPCSGAPPLKRLMDQKHSIETIVIYNGDGDLFLRNGFRPIIDNPDAINSGIDILRNATGINDIVLIIPEDTIQNYSGLFNASVKTVPSHYPSAQPLMVVYQIAGELPGPKGINSTNMCFLKPEAVASIGTSFRDGVLPIKKKVTITDKEGKKYSVIARIGTPIAHIFKTLDIKVDDGDKIILGGPLTGSAIYSEEHPILPDTDLILVQDKKTIPYYSNYPCINCGECIRVCPANVPVNLLVRFLEAGQYEEGADLYDLYSCIECGLCSYVCVSKIPVFQLIKLAKYKLQRTGYAEEMNE